MEMTMRSLFFALMAFGVLAGGSPTPAEARDYPFCILGRDYASPLGDCSYPTYAACKAAASGRYAYCQQNPFYYREDYDAPRRPRRGYRSTY
jgi:hypothetical protein